MTRPVTFEIQQTISMVTESVVVPVYAAANLSMQYQPFGGYANLRSVNGTGIKQTNWKKTRVIINAVGYLPAGLDKIDFRQPVTLLCSAPKAVQSTSNVIDVPAARRSDVPLEAYAVMDDQSELAPTTVSSVVTNTVTVATVPGAIAYRVNYWPQLQGFVNDPEETNDWRNAQNSWNLTFEEA